MRLIISDLNISAIIGSNTEIIEVDISNSYKHSLINTVW
jgi:hypothetical protein